LLSFIPQRAAVSAEPRRGLRKEDPVPDRQLCAGGIVHDAAARLLLIRRGQAPSSGKWSIPGGRCLPGESAAAACVREVAEETNVQVDVVRFAGRVERPAPDGGTHVIDDFLCRWVAGEALAGDDARDARWFTRAELATLDLAPGVYAALEEWGLLPA
jgi:ADP-ribose pyrophosphatase YjhB (NUDIX family)